MTPTVEMDVFHDALHDAIRLALEGRLADGYTMLLVGLERALESQAAGEPWAPEHVVRWRVACFHYAQQYGVALA